MREMSGNTDTCIHTYIYGNKTVILLQLILDKKYFSICGLFFDVTILASVLSRCAIFVPIRY